MKIMRKLALTLVFTGLAFGAPSIVLASGSTTKVQVHGANDTVEFSVDASGKLLAQRKEYNQSTGTPVPLDLLGRPFTKISLLTVQYLGAQPYMFFHGSIQGTGGIWVLREQGNSWQLCSYLPIIVTSALFEKSNAQVEILDTNHIIVQGIDPDGNVNLSTWNEQEGARKLEQKVNPTRILASRLFSDRLGKANLVLLTQSGGDLGLELLPLTGNAGLPFKQTLNNRIVTPYTIVDLVQNGNSLAVYLSSETKIIEIKIVAGSISSESAIDLGVIPLAFAIDPALQNWCALSKQNLLYGTSFSTGVIQTRNRPADLQYPILTWRGPGFLLQDQTSYYELAHDGTIVAQGTIQGEAQ